MGEHMEFDNKTIIITGLIICSGIAMFLNYEDIALAIVSGLVGYLSKDGFSMSSDVISPNDDGISPTNLEISPADIEISPQDNEVSIQDEEVE